jgi:nitrate/nitrite transport system substrate-binding protein
MVRWGQAAPDINIQTVADRVYRTDLYRAAAREMGVACPDADRLPPGGHGEPLGPAVEPAPMDYPTRLTTQTTQRGHS